MKTVEVQYCLTVFRKGLKGITRFRFIYVQTFQDDSLFSRAYLLTSELTSSCVRQIDWTENGKCHTHFKASHQNLNSGIQNNSLDGYHILGCAAKVNDIKISQEYILEIRIFKKCEGIPKCFDNSVISPAVFKSKNYRRH